MSLNKEHVIELLKSVTVALATDELSDGTLRVSTPFKYPDGSSIDVFVAADADLFEAVKVSDLGQTFAWLLDVAIQPWKSLRRRGFVQDAIRVLGVTHESGELFVRVETEQLVVDAVLQVAQAALRVSDLLYTQRYSRPGQFQDVFEEFLEGRELLYDERIQLITPRRVVEIPYRVFGRSEDSLVQLLSTRTPSAAHLIAEEAFMRWYDLQGQEDRSRRVSVYDDLSGTFSASDLDRLTDLSTVVPWTDQPSIAEVLSS